MTIEEIKHGENKNIEFKKELPDKSNKYIKTVIAFANTSGGKIVFGVEDKTREIVGVDESVVFSVMDSITNAISDSCEPVIIPDVSLQTIDGKTIIVVEISAEKQRPYYIKSLGVQDGTYIRVAGTTRHADENTIRELMFEGSNKSFDQSICLDFDITEADIDNLCKSLYDTAVDNCFSEEAKHEIKRVTKNTLLSWGALIEKNNKCYPTNAFALLTGNEAIPSKIQCGVFKGNNRAVFVDRREFTGPIQTQIEEAYQYVLAKINLGANIEGLYRQDMYELPPGSIREIIANAVTHRSYLEPGNVQVALYDDRLEVTSPGMLLNGVTIEKIREGYSKVRNRAIANAFSYMKIIEEWGSGIPRMYDEFSKYGLKEPELVDMDGDFRVNLYRKIHTDTNVGMNVGINVGIKLNQTQKKILSMLSKNPSLTSAKLAETLNVQIRTVERNIKELREKEILIRRGSKKDGMWIVDERYE